MKPCFFPHRMGWPLTSGEHLQLAATKNVAINAGSDISLGIMVNMTALAGEKLGGICKEGITVPVYTRTQENVELHVVQKKPQPQEMLWFIGDSSEQQMETELREQP